MDLLNQRRSGKENQADLAYHLRSQIDGDVRFDRLSRTLYSTDASIYEIIPVGVVLPKNIEDVQATIHVCHDYNTSIIARGAGTGLTGGAVGEGIQLDFSRYMNRIGKIDPDAQTVEVEPGVVLDELNRHLESYGLRFAPDVATSSRATIGGMIANNSCGANSILYGRTVDHVAVIKAVLAEGQVVTFGEKSFQSKQEHPESINHCTHIENELSNIRDSHWPEIEKRFPKVLRSNGGYGLDRLGPPGTPVNVVNILCGSEGTLGIIVGAKLKLIPIPPHKGLVILHFDHLLDALGVTLPILKHKPAAIELVDHLIIKAGRENITLRQPFDFLQGDPTALMIVEFHHQNANQLASQIDQLISDSDAIGLSYAQVKVLDSNRQQNVWKLRTSGLGLLMSRPGDHQPYAFVEDSAVDPSRLREYIERFGNILNKENVQAGYYAHASVGCIHVRPVLNLKKTCDIEKMKRIADAVSDLALEFGGAMTGEHGDGLLRSCWAEKMYGSQIVNAFKQVKKLFDPDGILNPHKIVDPYPMTDHLRFGESYETKKIKTYMDFSEYGGPAELAGMCSGVGQCRQKMVSTMCPSYMATGDENHTTRARANALRIALSNRGLLNGIEDNHLAEVMDLCLSCKACKTECPTGVDMARLKAEYLSHHNLMYGASARSRWITETPGRLKTASRFPRISNFIAQAKPFRAMLERKYGLDRRVAPPRLARQTFRKWFHRHLQHRPADQPYSRGRVIYFVDTWTNFFTPQVGIAAIKILERAGFEVICPPTVCCGRPAISQGLLIEAKELAKTNIRRLAHTINSDTSIVGTEPSCLLTLVDEYPQLIRTPVARKVASQSMMIETFLRKLIDEEPNALSFNQPETSIRYHAHCHQKALVGTEDAMRLFRHVWVDNASEIDSGCCGMAGAFGHEIEHYDIAQKIGEERLFPAVRNRKEANIAISGFSCRHQIEHHTNVKARHVVEYLADQLRAANT